MKYVSSFVVSWPWLEVVRSWRRDVLWIRRHHLRQPGIRRVGRKMEFWWKSGERRDKVANLHEVEVPVRKTFFFFNKMAVPYLLSGIFPKFWFRRRKRNRFLPKRVSSAVMFSIFGSGSCEEVHYCEKWLFAAVEIRRFLRRSLIFSAEGKNRSIFLRYLQKQVDVFKWQRETFFIIFSDVPKLFIVVSDQAFSILLMIFLSCPSWRRYCRGLRRLHEFFS